MTNSIQMDRQQEILRALASKSQYLSDVRHLQLRMPAVLASLAQAVQVRRAYIYENVTRSDGRLMGNHRLGWSANRRYLLENDPAHQNLDYAAIGFGRWMSLLLTGQPVYGNIHQFPASERAFLQFEGMRTIAVIPIISGGRCWGFIGFDDYDRERRWTAGEIEALTYAGLALGTALETERLFHAEAERRREAEILNQVSSYLTQAIEPTEALQQALAALINHLTGDLVISVTLLDTATQELEILAQKANCMSADEQIEERIRLAEAWASRRVVEEKRPFAQHYLDPDQPTLSRTRRSIAAGLRAILYLPLLLQSEVVGVLHIDVYNQPRQFSGAEITLCQGIANLMAATLERQRLLATQRQQLHLARTLQQVGALLTTQLNLDEVYDQIFDLLAQVVTYDSVSIQLLDETKNHLYMVAGRGFPDETGVKKFIHAIAQHCLNKFPPNQTYTVSPDTFADPRWVRGASVDYIRSWVGALLRVKGDIIGILNVDSRQVGAFDEQTAVTVAAFANQAAIAIENARLYKEAQLRANELSILNEVALATAATVDVDELLSQTTHTIASRLYSECFGFVLVDHAAGIAWAHSSFHGATADMLRQPIPLEQSLTGLVVESGQAEVMPDVSLETRYWAYDPAFRAAVAVPLKIDGEVIGVITAESRRVSAFSLEDVRFLSTLAGFVGLALARTRLYQRLRQQSDSLAAEVQTRTAELQSERDRTLTILESVGESIILTDKKATILYVNQAAMRQSGYTEAELIGQTPNMLESGLTPRKVYEEMWQTILQGRQWSGELINRRKDGALYDVSMTIAPIFDTHREIINFVSIQADITRLKEVDRLKTKFVSNVSHELRTPLTNIKTYVTLLERGHAEKRARYLNVLHHETDRLTQIIQDLLDLSLLDAESATWDAAADLRQSVLDYVDVFMAKADVRQITISLDMPQKLPAVSIASRHLGQLLTNLLGNALAYTPVGGQVRLAAGEAECAGRPCVWLRLADTGMGIAAADLPHVFDRFFRGEQAQQSGVPGTGLGLAICQEIVRRYEGQISVESVEGEGTTFSVWLPVATVPLRGVA